MPNKQRNNPPTTIKAKEPTKEDDTFFTRIFPPAFHPSELCGGESMVVVSCVGAASPTHSNVVF
jgi:hypothetical protein